MQNAIYYGEVTHARLTPNQHCFKYSIGMLCIDVNDINQYKILGCLRIKRKNYLPNFTGNISEAIQKLLIEQGYPKWSGKAFLIANPSQLGYCYNPVIFFYCFDSTGNSLQYIIAEIHNTPWGERHQYIIPYSNNSTTATASFQKAFHISPFFPMEIQYVWKFDYQDNNIKIMMQSFQKDSMIFSVVFNLKEYKLSSSALWKYFISSPFRSHLLHFRIYWQALLLYFKRTPFFAHPKTKEP